MAALGLLKKVAERGPSGRKFCRTPWNGYVIRFATQTPHCDYRAALENTSVASQPLQSLTMIS